MTNKQERMEPGTLIGAAVTDAIEAVADLIVDPREYVRVELGELLKRYRYPTLEKERQAAHCLRGFLPRIEELVKFADIRSLAQVLGDLQERCRRIAIPDRVPTFHDDYRERVRGFLDMSWSIEEAEAVRHFCQPGDRIGEITPSSVKLGNREIARAEVREALAARGWLKGRLAQLAEIERNRIRVDANNRERAAKGLAPIVYTGNGVAGA
jgi:hypothetical protein